MTLSAKKSASLAKARQRKKKRNKRAEKLMKSFLLKRAKRGADRPMQTTEPLLYYRFMRYKKTDVEFRSRLQKIRPDWLEDAPRKRQSYNKKAQRSYVIYFMKLAQSDVLEVKLSSQDRRRLYYLASRKVKELAQLRSLRPEWFRGAEFSKRLLLKKVQALYLPTAAKERKAFFSLMSKYSSASSRFYDEVVAVAVGEYRAHFRAVKKGTANVSSC